MTKANDKHPANGIVSGGGTEDQEALNFDDGEIYSGRSTRTHTGGTTAAKGGDSGKLGPPAEQLSSTNAPSDPDTRHGRDPQP